MDNSAALERNISNVENCLPDCRNSVFASTEKAMLGQVALIRGCQYAYTGKIEPALAHLVGARASFQPGRTLYRASAVALGVCYFAWGRLEEAQLLFEENVSITDVKNNVLVPVTAILGLARTHLLRGRLRAAKQVYDKGMQDCLACGRQDVPACGLLHLGLGELAYEMHDLIQAEQHLARGVEMTAVGMQYVNTWGRVLLAQTKLALGITVDILEPHREASILKYAGRFVVDLPPLSAAIARLMLSQRRLDAVLHWTEAARLPCEGPLSIGREQEYLVLARYFLVTEKVTGALALLERLWTDAEQGRRLTVMTEILVLKALALQSQGATDDALGALKQALALAADSGLLRIFISDGAMLGTLLKKLARGTDYTSFAHHLLGYCVNDSAHRSDMHTAPLPLLFSKKEKQVVGYIAKGVSNQEIAQALFISGNTLNSHMKSIYSKLGVNSRLQAVERLNKLGLAS